MKSEKDETEMASSIIPTVEVDDVELQPTVQTRGTSNKMSFSSRSKVLKKQERTQSLESNNSFKELRASTNCTVAETSLTVGEANCTTAIEAAGLEVAKQPDGSCRPVSSGVDGGKREPLSHQPKQNCIQQVKVEMCSRPSSRTELPVRIVTPLDSLDMEVHNINNNNNNVSSLCNSAGNVEEDEIVVVVENPPDGVAPGDGVKVDTSKLAVKSRRHHEQTARSRFRGQQQRSYEVRNRNGNEYLNEQDGSPDEISVASSEACGNKRSSRRLISKEVRVRSYSADRVLDDNLSIPLVPLVHQSAGCDIPPDMYRNEINTSSRYQHPYYLQQEDSRQSSSRQNSSRQDSFSSRLDSSISRLDSSMSRQHSCDNESPVVRSKLTTDLYKSRHLGSRYWGHRRSYTASLWDNRLTTTSSTTALNRNSYANMRHSTDILDRLEKAKPTRSKLDEVEENLLLGNMDAATDIHTLKTYRVSHIITVDSVPLPRKITSLLPRLACMHIQVTDIPSEDLLSHFPSAIEFIENGMQSGVVLVHCYYGKSRSASVITAYLMYKQRMSVESALQLLKSKRSCISPNPGFRAQLRLWEAMKWKLDPGFLRYKMYKVHLISERMRKAKIIPVETLSPVLESLDESRVASASIVYKCKECRRTLATNNQQFPHLTGETPYWYNPIWKQDRSQFCNQSVYLAPVSWMGESIRSSLSGKLHCPYCRARCGEFSWVLGLECPCGASVSPAFRLDITTIIFKTGRRHLQSSGREPVLV